MLASWRDRVRRLKIEVAALALAARDTRTPWYAKAVAAAVVAYALSPIDLIPDVIPVLGHLDDFVLVPLGLWLAIRLVPPDVLADCRRQAASANPPARSRTAAVVIVALWIAAAALTLHWLGKLV